MIVEPSPSRPSLFVPQQYARFGEALATEHECDGPDEILDIGTEPDEATGVAFRSDDAPAT